MDKLDNFVKLYYELEKSAREMLKTWNFEYSGDKGSTSASYENIDALGNVNFKYCVIKDRDIFRFGEDYIPAENFRKFLKKGGDYPKYYTHIEGFSDGTAYIRLSNKMKGDVILGNHKVYKGTNYTEEECESSVKRGYWKRISKEEAKELNKKA